MADTSEDLSTAPQTTYYFGYGSNLWLDQMRRRCPSSKHIGIAILHDWKWIICDRGYANVIPSRGDSVWGMVYILSAHDEAYLDRNEGVPTIYQKKLVSIDFMPKNGSGVDGGMIEGLVYVDVERTSIGTIEEEYIYRMNQGIRDAVQMGMLEEYVARYLRPFIPTEDPPGVGEVVDPFAVR